MENITKPQVRMYKDSPVLDLPTNGWKPFSFGVAKAEIILANLPTIKSFVAQAKAVAGNKKG